MTWLAVGAAVLGGAGPATVAAGAPAVAAPAERFGAAERSGAAEPSGAMEPSGAAEPSAATEPSGAADTGRPARARTLAFGGTASERTLPRTGTEEFSLIGVSWADHTRRFDGTAQVRTRSAETGRWSGWRDLDFDIVAPETDEAAAADTRGASEPLWTGPSDAVEARVVADGRQRAVPGGLRLDLIDPGTTTAEATATAPSTATSQGRAETTAPARPPIVSRAGWGADESLVKDPAEYIPKVEAVFVHHTAGTNDYTCADSAAVIRAIFVYHVQSNGWNDVGYNFFVDKCGTLFEGRAGGVDQRIRGAHTYGFNGVSSGVSLLGNYEDGGTPTPAALSAIADLAAWKLGLDGVDPQGRVTLTAAGDTGVYEPGEKATLYTVSGHRDGYATLCPGQTLYDRLPDIRTQAAASPYATR
ncbi:peptidoglycan recognition protein [Streptomyces sp. NPDC052687]|uniref:peptidoglycan recognition protein family protein n=1 Tax=Streptomyces sp. NPDC052687 TaxID=3154759 RepID=UPI00341ED65C